MNKIIIAALLLFANIIFAQWPPERSNPEYYPSVRVADSLRLDFLGSVSDTVFLVRFNNTTTLQTLTITQIRTLLGGVTAAQLSDTADVVRAEYLADLADYLRIEDTAGMLSTYARIEVLSDTAAVLRSLINSSSGGSSGPTDTIIISGGRDTITNASEGVLFISLSETEDTLYLAPNLTLDSLSQVFFEKHRSGDLIIDGGLTNNLNESAATTLTVPARGGGFITCLGTIDGAIRFSAIGNYTQE